MAEIKIPQLENDLKNDDQLLKDLVDDPRDVLKRYGIEMDDAATDKIKELLNNQVGPNSPNPIDLGIPDMQAIYVAIKI